MLAEPPTRGPAGIAIDDRGRAGRWPLEVDGDEDGLPLRDPFVSLVRSFIHELRAGAHQGSHERSADRVTWSVRGNGPVSGDKVGIDEIAAYHSELIERSDGTFRQLLLALRGSGGPIVEAHLRTIAERPGKRLETPTLLVFELAGGRLRQITEMPGDERAWDDFWAD